MHTLIHALTRHHLARATRHDRRAWLHFLTGNISYALGSLRKADRNHARAAAVRRRLDIIGHPEMEEIIERRVREAQARMESAFVSMLWGEKE